jgi:hypothetical protein
MLRYHGGRDTPLVVGLSTGKWGVGVGGLDAGQKYTGAVQNRESTLSAIEDVVPKIHY